MVSTRQRSIRVGLLLGGAVTLLIVGILVLRGGGGGDLPPRLEAGTSGAALPSVTYERFDGGTTDLSEFAGRPLVLNLWASWCPPCIKEMPDFERVHADLGDRVTFVGVNSKDLLDEARATAERAGVTYPLVRDPRGKLLEGLKGSGMPMTVFVDARGTIVDIHNGALTEADLRARLTELFGL